MADPTAIPTPIEDAFLHSDTSPFCYDPGCTCHKKAFRIEQVMEAVQQGLFTPEEASAFVAGHSLWAGGNNGEEASR